MDEEKEKELMEILNISSVKPVQEDWTKRFKLLIDTIFTKVSDLKSVTEDYYGKENVDLQYTYSNIAEHSRESIESSYAYVKDPVYMDSFVAVDNNIRFPANAKNASVFKSKAFFNLIIKIPEVQLISETGLQHTMYDCYFRLSFTFSMTLKNIVFYRGKRSVAEFFTSYLFSHAHKAQAQSTVGSGLCLGSGTSLSNVYAQIISEGYYEDETILFIIGLKDYVAYESITGSPYIRIDTITNPKNNSRYSLPDEAAILNIYRALVAKGFNFNLNMLPSGMLKIENQLETWKLISSVVSPSHLFEYDTERNVVLDKDSSLELLNSHMIDYNHQTRRQGLFRFKDHIVYETIYNPLAQTNGEEKIKLCKEALREKILEITNMKLNEYDSKQFHSYAY